METNILGKEPIQKLLVKFALPSIIGMIFVAIQGMIDGIFVGNFIGSKGLAGINIAQPFSQFVMAYSLTIGVGAQTLVGIFLGEKEEKKAQDMYKTGLLTTLFFSLVIGLLGFAFSSQIAGMLGAQGEVLIHSSLYIKTIACFLPFVGTMFLFEFLVRTIGKPEISLIAMVVSVLVNIVLDYILIKVFSFGVVGAAFATGVSYFIALVIELIPFFKKDSIIQIFKGDFISSQVWPMIYNGSSEGVSSLASAISMFLFNIALMKTSGVNGVVAFSVVSYFSQVGYMLLFGIADAIRPIVSYNYGASYKNRMSELLQISIKLNFLIGLFIFGFLTFVSPHMVSLFIKDNASVIPLVERGASIYAFAFLFNGFNILISSYFTAIDDALYSIIVALSRGLIFMTIGIFILPNIFGISGVFLTIVFAEISTLIVSLILCKKSEYVFFKLKLEEA